MRKKLVLFCLLALLTGCVKSSTSTEFTSLMYDAGYNIAYIDNTNTVSHYLATNDECSIECITFKTLADAQAEFLALNEECMLHVTEDSLHSYNLGFTHGNFQVETTDSYCAVYLKGDTIIYAMGNLEKKESIMTAMKICSSCYE